MEQLRPEFAEGVLALRKKILGRIKPKRMHGKNLNGEMLYNLALNYVDAINKGVVPNIETAWSYISRNQCQKAQFEAFEKFETELQQELENGSMEPDQLK